MGSIVVNGLADVCPGVGVEHRAEGQFCSSAELAQSRSGRIRRVRGVVGFWGGTGDGLQGETDHST